MSFIKKLFGEKISQEGLEKLIELKIEESLHLDYKHFRAIDDLDKLAKHVSSFANSDGGLIILGMEQDVRRENGTIVKVFPKKIIWGNLKHTKESLEQKLTQRIDPDIPDLKIIPVRNEKEEVVFLIDIPKSNFAPHMSQDHTYQKRINFGTQAMEHYEVKKLFNVNWTMKEKLVEKVYEPLSTILMEHVEQLDDYSCPEITKIQNILSKQYYYISKIGNEFEEEIDSYINRIISLARIDHFALVTIKKMIVKGVGSYLGSPFDQSDDESELRFTMVDDKDRFGLQLTMDEMKKLILKKNGIKDHINEEYFKENYCKIKVYRNGSTRDIDLTSFDEKLWKSFLDEASQNEKIKQMSDSIDSLIDYAWYIFGMMAEI